MLCKSARLSRWSRPQGRSLPVHVMHTNITPSSSSCSWCKQLDSSPNIAHHMIAWQTPPEDPLTYSHCLTELIIAVDGGKKKDTRSDFIHVIISNFKWHIWLWWRALLWLCRLAIYRAGWPNELSDRLPCWVQTLAESNQWLKHGYLSFNSQALGIVRIGLGLVASISEQCDWVGYQFMVLLMWFSSGAAL